MKIIAQIERSPSGFMTRLFYSEDDLGHVIEGVSYTLLDFIEESHPERLEKIADILKLEKMGKYVQEDSGIPVWGMNDKNVWLGPPRVEKGFVLISNENISDYSEEYGTPQKFSIEQFLAAIAHWIYFCTLFSEKSDAELSDMVGMKFEAEI